MPPSPDSLPNSLAQIAQGERALAELGPKLEAIADLAVVRPSTDPQGAAATALLVADYLAQPELKDKLSAVGMTPALVVELQSLARAMITVVLRLDGDYLPDAPSIPGELVQKGQAVRATVANALEKALPDDAELQVWLEAVRLGSGVVDLVYDLRTLAERCAYHSANDAAARSAAGSIQPALSAADAIEFALRTGDAPATTQSRDALARLWTLFLPAYDRAATAARALTKDEGHVRTFPALALVASHRRARRRPLSVMPSHAPAATAAKSTPPKRPSMGVPVAIRDAEDPVSSSQVPQAARPASVPPADRADWSDTRRANRHGIEIEVGISSESNFYLGFTENLSSGGVFVATYVIKPLGSPIEVTLSFPSGDQLLVRGVVRWQRDATPDAWPGMGVQFESLSPADEAKVRKFLSLREPMFYDE